MAEKLTMKVLSGELETLRRQLRKVEKELEYKVEQAMEKAAEKLRSRIETLENPASQTQGIGGAVDVDARRRLIAERAYLRAERRGFTGGSPEQDWIEAEMEVDRLLLQQPVTGDQPESVRKKGPARKENRAAK